MWFTPVLFEDTQLDVSKVLAFGDCRVHGLGPRRRRQVQVLGEGAELSARVRRVPARQSAWPFASERARVRRRALDVERPHRQQVPARGVRHVEAGETVVGREAVVHGRMRERVGVVVVVECQF